MSITPAQRHNIINEVIAMLEGSTNTLNGVLAQFGFDEANLTEEELQIIHNQIEICDQCGWWVAADEIGERKDGCICIECEDDNKQEKAGPDEIRDDGDESDS